MNPNKADQWKNDALDRVFEALAANETLTARFIYKGARVLNRLLNDATRQSLDIDVNLTNQFVEQYPDRQDQLQEIQSEISIALARFFDSQEEIFYTLEDVNVKQKSKHKHPMGWEAFVVRIRLRDHRLPNVLGIPALEIDIAAPENLGPHAIAPLEVGDYEVKAYTLERIAGEKLRAFLSSLPTYREKVKKPGEAIRAKDVYDIARIITIKPIDDETFWIEAAKEFRRACQSRYIDCKGIDSFEGSFEVIRITYERESIIPKNIPFQEAWDALSTVVAFWESKGVIPFQFDLPSNASCP